MLGFRVLLDAARKAQAAALSARAPPPPCRAGSTIVRGPLRRLLDARPGSSPFRDALVRSAPGPLPAHGLVPGSLLSFVSAASAPAISSGERAVDALASAADPEGRARHLAVERWTLEEAALSAALVRDVVDRLRRDDALGRGTLVLAGERLGPDRFAVPLLAIASPAEAIAPPAAVAPFLEAVRRSVPARLVRWPRGRGTVFGHLSAVLGPRAHAGSGRQSVAGWRRERRASRPGLSDRAGRRGRGTGPGPTARAPTGTGGRGRPSRSGRA